MNDGSQLVVVGKTRTSPIRSRFRSSRLGGPRPFSARVGGQGPDGPVADFDRSSMDAVNCYSPTAEELQRWAPPSVPLQSRVQCRSFLKGCRALGS